MTETAFLALAILAALIALFLYESVRIAVHLMISRQMTKKINKFERHIPQATKRILFIGDSTGYGTGASHARHTVVGRIGADLPDAHIENESGSSSFLSKVPRVLKEKTVSYDLVIIMLGGMDIVSFRPMSQVRLILSDALCDAKRYGREVILVSPNNTGRAPLHHFPLSRIYEMRARQFDNLYRAAAEAHGIRHVSLFDAPLEHFHYSPDKTHPNDDGYGIWYDRLKEVVRAVFAKL